MFQHGADIGVFTIKGPEHGAVIQGVAARQDQIAEALLVHKRASRREARVRAVALLTAVGVPQILAGDEFADQHDLSVGNPAKQRDPVNYDRVEEPFRRRIFEYVARLVKLRTSEPALSTNDTAFLHTDFDGKRVLVWRRGLAGSDSQVVVVANFSEFGTDTRVAGAEYRVPDWPAAPAGLRWREVTQDRDVPGEWVGREPIFPWEAKIYVLRPS